MHRTGLHANAERALLRLLRTHHEVRIRTSILDLDGHVGTTVSNRLLEGQVTVDATAAVTRGLSIVLSDPHGKLPFDSLSPDDGALYADKMIQIGYGVHGDDGYDWFEIDVFTGPVTKLDRQADEVSVEAQGKEILASEMCWDEITFKKNTRKTDVIHDLLAQRCGERSFDLPDLRGRLDDDLSLGRESIPWTVCQRLARGMGRQLFYDGSGVLRLRRAPDNHPVVFADGDGGTVISPPQVSYQTNDLRNVVWFVGGTPKGAKKPIEAVATPKRDHPLSPWSLGRTLRNGTRVPRRMVEKIEDDTVRSQNEADEAAEKRLTELLRQSTDVTLDAWPTNPLLEERDVGALRTSMAHDQFTLRQFNIPLLVSDVQTIGYVDRTRVRRAMRRHRR